MKIFDTYIKLQESGYIKDFVGWFALSVCVLALCLNIPILIITIKKYIKTNDKKLIILITISDIMLSLSVIVFQLVRSGTKFHIYLESHFYCQFEGLLLSGLVHTSLYSVSILSLERYFLIVRKQQYNGRIWLFTILIASLITWILSFNLFYFGEFELMPSAAYCLLSYNSGWLSKLSVFVFSLEGLLACSVLVFSYMCIMMTRIRQIQKIKEVSKKSEFNTIQKPVKSRVTMIKIIGVMMVYLACLFPTIISFIYEVVTGRPKPLLLDVISVCLISCTNLGNAVLVLILHKETRAVLFSLFKFD